MQTQTSNTLHNVIMEAGSKDRPLMLAPVDACPNACEIWKAIKRLKQGESINVKDLETNLYWEFRKFTSQDGESLESYYLRIGNVAGAKDTVGSSVVQKYGIQCYNCKEFGHVARDCQKPKRAKDATYHREKMLLYVVDSRPIFDDEPLQKVSNDDHYNVFAIKSIHPEQSKSVHDTYPIEQDAQNVITDSLDMNYDREEIDQNDDDNDLDKEQMKDKLSAHQETISILSKQKEAQIKLYKTREYKELEKVIELENKVKVLDKIVYKTGQSVQMINMLNNKCGTSFKKPEFLKKAQRENPRMYDIGCYNDNLALMLAPDSDEVIRLEKKSRSKLSDLIRPFDYDKLNNLYDLFITQHEKSSKQRYFSERSRLSHINVNNRKSKEAFNKQITLLEKRMDESVQLDKQCQSSIKNFKVKMYVNTIITGVELCKQKIANKTYIGYIDPFFQNTIEQNFSPVISRINAGLDQFHRCLNEEMVADLRYFNSLELEVDSLRFQLETQKTQFLNEID
nr:hypothetical protein [Tanacetum cinerariifolium]